MASPRPPPHCRCVLGFDRMGIWGMHADHTPISAINACHAIRSEPNGDEEAGKYASAYGGKVGRLEARLGAAANSRAVLGTPGAIERTTGGTGLILTAGDRGDVRLLRLPSLVRAAPAREGLAHCDRVSCVRFLNAGTLAVSSGLYDQLIVVWEVVAERRSYLPDYRPM